MKSRFTRIRRRAFALAVFATLGSVPALSSIPAFAEAPAENMAWGELETTAVIDLNASEAIDGPIQQVSADDPVAPLVDAPADTSETTEPIPAPVIEYADMAPTAAPCACCNSTCCTKKKKDAATDKMKGAIKGVFYLNDYSYLNDKCYDGPSFCGDSLKGMLNGHLDVGGEARVRYHHENNMRGLGLTGRDDEFFLTRYRMFANLRLSENLRVYGEYLYADSAGEVFNNRPIEENRGELQNMFVDVNLTDSVSVRGGRQELLFGAQRLISPLDWANTRRTFDGGRVTYKGDDWNLDGFFVHPVNRDAAHEDKLDTTNNDVDFYGVYGSRKGTALGDLDVYYLALDDSVLDFDYHTLGSRVSGETDGKTMYDFEGGVQFGSNSPGFGDHSAGFMTGGLGRKLNLSLGGNDWNPVVWAWYDWASGGDDVPAARGDASFDHLFPLAHKYNGFMDLFGRRNLHDVNFQFITPLMTPKVNLLLWYHHFFLDQATTPYGVTMAPFNAANAAGDRELGQEIDVLFNVNINPRNNVLVGYSHFNAGAYYDTTVGVPTNADADFFYFQYQTQF
ncbi:alginate export family protein [Stieleria varia]|uniref:Alginate export domain-containing protein n=1 Tax=Stieleria varia TaxID=2528005 RepID=A0A5C5ZQJ9_9BACT|nr:alginate export family protein [Stieleria varia]TWT89335.1 hypothetical protein Pla52n_68370 [Stieleria varia]